MTFEELPIPPHIDWKDPEGKPTLPNLIGAIFYDWCYRVFKLVTSLSTAFQGIFPSNTDDTVWDDLRFPATGINPPGLVTDPAIDTTNIGLIFEDAKDTRIDIIGQLPHKYKANTVIVPHIHWSPVSNSSGNVIWQLAYKWYNNTEQAPSFTYVNVNAVVTASASATNSRITSFSNIDTGAGGKRESSLFKASILRLGITDSYSGNVLFDEFDIHFQAEKLGSTAQFP